MLSNNTWSSGSLPGQTKFDVYYSRNPSPSNTSPHRLARAPEPVRGLTARTALQAFSQGQRLNFFPVLHRMTLPSPLPSMEVAERGVMGNCLQLEPQEQSRGLHSLVYKLFLFPENCRKHTFFIHRHPYP